MTLAELQKDLTTSSGPNAWPEGGIVTANWVHHLSSSLDANTRSGEPPRNLSKCVFFASPIPPYHTASSTTLFNNSFSSLRIFVLFFLSIYTFLKKPSFSPPPSAPPNLSTAIPCPSSSPSQSVAERCHGEALQVVHQHPHQRTNAREGTQRHLKTISPPPITHFFFFFSVELQRTRTFS